MVKINRSLKLSGLVFIKTIVLVLMVFIINVSLVAIGIAITKPTDGYTVYYSEDGGKTLDEVYTHYYKDGEDLKYNALKNDEHYYKKEIAGKLNDNVKNIIDVISYVCGFLLLIAIFYNEFWREGDKDATDFEFSKKPYNKYKGFKIALLGTSPFILSYIILIISKLFNILPSFSRYFYFINYYMYYIIGILIPNIETKDNGILNILATIIVLIPIPLICAIAYNLGTKHLDIKKSIMYKKEEK